MAHMEPLSKEEAFAAVPELRAASEKLESKFGFIPNSIRTMARRPELVVGFMALQKGAMAPGDIPFELKKLVSHVASKAAGCVYCQGHSAYTSGRAGIEAERLEKLWEYQSSDLFTDAERVAFDYAIAAASVPNQVTPELHARLSEHYDDGQIVELLGVISLFGFLNRWNDSMATELEDPAVIYTSELLGDQGWEAGKHSKQP